MLKVPTLGGEPEATCVRNFVWVRLVTVVLPAVGAWLLTRDWAPTVGVAAIAAALHLLRYMVPQWAWMAVVAVGCGVMMWLVGGSVFLIAWAVSIAPLVWLGERYRRRSSGART